MTRQAQVWAVVDTTSASKPEVLAVESSELRALRVAVSAGASVVRWQFGESIESALERDGGEQAAPAPARAPRTEKSEQVAG